MKRQRKTEQQSIKPKEGGIKFSVSVSACVRARVCVFSAFRFFSFSHLFP